MAKAKKQATVQRQARRAMGTIRRRSHQAKAAIQSRTLTLGELIAAAYDTLGNEVKDVARVLGSADLACAIHKRIVVTR